MSEPDAYSWPQARFWGLIQPFRVKGLLPSCSILLTQRLQVLHYAVGRRITRFDNGQEALMKKVS